MTDPVAGIDIRRSPAAGDAAPGDLVGVSGGDAMQLIPDTGATTRAQSRIIYLNRGGITVTVGTNDSRANRSSLVDRPRTIPAWTTLAAGLTALLARCRRRRRTDQNQAGRIRT